VFVRFRVLATTPPASGSCAINIPLTPTVNNVGPKEVNVKLFDGHPFVIEALELDFSSCMDDSQLIEAPFMIEFVDGTDTLGKQMLSYAKVGFRIL